MSQLDNTNENNNNEDPILSKNTNKKMKTSTKIIIFLIVFALICIAITIGAILITNQNSQTTSPSQPTSISNDGLGIKNLTEQYDENDLKIIDINDKKGKRTVKYDWDTNTGKVNIDYIKIDGLKNEKIENKINKEIMVLVYGLYNDSDLNDTEIDYIQIHASCEANFGNTLSVYVGKTTFYVDEEAELNTESYALNYDLTTGNKIKFTDLFTNSSLKNVLIQSIYDNVVSNHTFFSEDNEWVIDMSKADLSTVEEETYVMLNKLISNLDNIEFYYTPSYIYIDAYELSISMSNIHSNIAIYNRFKTSESIFDKTYEGNKNMFVFSKRYSYVDTQYSRYEDIYDNLRIEALVEMDKDLLHNSLAKEKLNELTDKIESEISKIKKEAKNNPKKAYLYTAYFSMYSGQSFELSLEGIPNDMLYTWGDSKVYKMTFDYFNEVFLAEIASFYNSPEPAEYWPVFEYYKEDKNVKVETITELDENIDLYTGKTSNKLLGELHIEGEKKGLQEIQDTLDRGENYPDLENELVYIYNSIISVKEQYKLEDSDIKELLDWIDKIKTTVKNKEQENLNNATSTNIIENTNSIIINTIE